MIPAAFDYARARSLRDVFKALESGDTKLIAGGHSLLPLMRLRLAQPARLLDIGGLDDLRGITVKGRGVRIGAGSTYRELLDSELLQERYPVLIETVAGIADLQVRNRGTIGGGLAHADPASDTPALMLALDASFTLRSKSGRRSVPAREFFLGAFSTALREDELLTDIVLPPLPRKAGAAHVTFEQKASGYAIAAATAVVTRKGKTFGSALVAVTGVGDRAYLASVDAVVGLRNDDDAGLDSALWGLTAGIEVNGDIHATAEYRAHLARVAARRALRTAWERSG